MFNYDEVALIAFVILVVFVGKQIKDFIVLTYKKKEIPPMENKTDFTFSKIEEITPSPSKKISHKRTPFSQKQAFSNKQVSKNKKSTTNKTLKKENK